MDKASVIFSVWSKRCRTGDEGAGLTTEAVHSRSVDHRREVAPHLVVGDPVGAKGLTRTGRAPFYKLQKRGKSVKGLLAVLRTGIVQANVIGAASRWELQRLNHRVADE